jgi:beta-glucosidase
MPVKELKAFKRVYLSKAGSAVVDFRIPVTELQKWDLQKHQWKLYGGNYTIVVGADSKDEKLTATFIVHSR